MNVLNENGYVDSNYYYILLQKIFGIANELNNYNIKILLHKIPSHRNIRENNIADVLAKNTAKIAQDCKYRKSDCFHYNLYWNPITIDQNKDLIWLRKIHRQEREKAWEKRQSDWFEFNMNDNIYKGTMIIQKLICKNNKISKATNKMRNDLRYLKMFE